MALTDRITKLINRLRPPRETTQRTTYERASAGVAGLLTPFREARDRREVIEACNEMYKGDTRPKAVIDRVADGAVRRGFTLSVAPADAESSATNDTQAKKAQTILNALVERTGVEHKAHRYLRRVFRDGDLFLQAVVDSQKQVASLHRMPTQEMHRNSNDIDEFDDPAFAYWQAPHHSAYSYTLTPPMRDAEGRSGVTWFADWQIIHARWDHDEGERYGRPLLSAARGPFKRYREGETDMAVRRKTRAGLKYLHQIKSDATDAIENYKKANKAALTNPLAAVVDFFSAGEASVTAIQGDARLGELADVLHHLDAFFAVSPLPMALIGYGRDINRDVLRDQYQAYLRALDEIAEWFEGQVLRPLFELELLLHGIVPDNVTITVQWAEKDELPFSVEDWERLYRSGKLTDETILRLLQKILPDFDAESEIELQRKLQEEQAEAEAKDANGRVPGDWAALMAQLQGHAKGDDEEGSEGAARDENDTGDEEPEKALVAGANGRAAWLR